MKEKLKSSKWVPYIITAIVGIYIICNIGAFVGASLGGNYNWLVLPAKMFGMPEQLAQYNKIEPLYQMNDGCGWDGQFYYYISNDLLGTKGYSNYVDAPSYRWQRIGLPLIAKLVSVCLFRKQVSVLLYTIVHLIIVLSGFFIAIKYLKRINRAFVWAVPWVLSCGVMITIRCGLPDAAADALFIIAFIYLLEKKYMLYSIFMSATCLSREGYVLVAFCVFVLFLLNKMDKLPFIKRKKIYFRNFVTIAMPGILFVVWYFYVSWNFGIMPYKQAKGITNIYMVGWIQNLVGAFSSNNYVQVIGLLFYFIIVIWSLVAAIKVGKINCIYWGLIPYIVLVSSFGDTVLCHWTGYLKGISILYFFLPLMVLQYNKQSVIIKEYQNNEFRNREINITQRVQVTLAVFLAFSLLMSYEYLSKWGGNILKISNYMYTPAEVTENVQNIENYNCDFEVVSYDYDKYAKIPEKLVKAYAIAKVSMKNNGNQTWSHIGDAEGRGAVKLSYQIFQNGEMIQDGDRYNLLSDVQPGEGVEREIYISYPEQKGNYVVRISLLQEGVSWFYTQNSGYQDFEITVK